MKDSKAKPFDCSVQLSPQLITLVPAPLLEMECPKKEPFKTLPFMTSQWALMSNATRQLPAVCSCLWDKNFHCVLPFQPCAKSDTVRKSQIVLAAGCKQRAKYAALILLGF